MKEWLERQKQRPWIAHLLRAVARFTARLGAEFGAAITYFSVLALVPLLMVTFAIAGFVLTTLRPDLLAQFADRVASVFGEVDAGTKERVLALLNDALGGYTLVGLVGLLSALYSGAGWMKNLKNAVRAQWRPTFDLQPVKSGIVRDTATNLVTLLGLVAGILVSFAAAGFVTSLGSAVIAGLGLDAVGWLVPVLRVVPIGLSLAVGWLLFMYLFAVLPETREPWPLVRRGALIGAIGLGALQYLASFLIDLFSGRAAAALFGPVIVLMLFFDLFAQLILFVAAWIATAEHDVAEAPADEQKVRFALTPEGAPAEAVMVSQDVAARGVRVGLGAGYLTGAATGAGLGATLAYLASRLARRRGNR